jgi:hypothetical protein
MKTWISRGGWGLVIVLGCMLGVWIASAREKDGRRGLLRAASARLAIQTVPEGPFKVTIAQTVDGEGRIFDGANAIDLEPGDYFVDVIPASKQYQRKRLKVHLSSKQMLALPVVLTPSGPLPVELTPVVRDPIAAPPTIEPEVTPEEELPDAPPMKNVRGVLDIGRDQPGAKVDPVFQMRVADALPEVTDKDVDREALGRYIRSRKAAIQSCFEKQEHPRGKEARRLKGKIVVAFNITPMGRSSEIAIEKDTTGNPLTGSCIKSIIRGWVYPFKPEQNVRVVQSFELKLAQL